MAAIDPARRADIAAISGASCGGAAQAVLRIDLDAIAANWRAMRAAHGGLPVAAVVKADAYGLGVGRVVPRLAAEGCRHFFVASIEEAAAVRPLASAAMVSPLNGLLVGTEADYLACDATPALSSLDEVARWTAVARLLERKLDAILHIDTGLNRLGMPLSELAELVADPGRLAGLRLRYVMSHLVDAECADDPANQIQLDRFRAACTAFPAVPRSLGNSAGIVLGGAWRSDLARAGVALYGLCPAPRGCPPLRNVVELRAQIRQVRAIEPGEGVGYEWTWRARRPGRIATLGVGYADGWPRALSNRGVAYAGDIACPLVGRVSMDLSSYDVTAAESVRPGDWLELIGPRRPLADVAASANTNGYEILTALGRRYRRVWLP
jgi:alanine racemase